VPKIIQASANHVDEPAVAGAGNQVIRRPGRRPVEIVVVPVLRPTCIA
jgi:hypothetical protein